MARGSIKRCVSAVSDGFIGISLNSIRYAESSRKYGLNNGYRLNFEAKQHSQMTLLCSEKHKIRTISPRAAWKKEQWSKQKTVFITIRANRCVKCVSYIAQPLKNTTRGFVLCNCNWYSNEIYSFGTSLYKF